MKKIGISISRGWTLVLCSFSAVILALTASCRSSRRVQKSDALERERTELRIREMQQEADSLQKILDRRRNSVMYGSLDVMRRYAEESRKMQDRVYELDSLTKELENTLK